MLNARESFGYLLMTCPDFAIIGTVRIDPEVD